MDKLSDGITVDPSKRILGVQGSVADGLIYGFELQLDIDESNNKGVDQVDAEVTHDEGSVHEPSGVHSTDAIVVPVFHDSLLTSVRILLSARAILCKSRASR